MDEQGIIAMQKVASRLTPEKSAQWMREHSALIDSEMEKLTKANKKNEDDPIFPNLIELGL